MQYGGSDVIGSQHEIPSSQVVVPQVIPVGGEPPVGAPPVGAPPVA
jgi:hypothetical protein